MSNWCASQERRIELERAADPDARDLVMRAWARYYRPFSASNSQEALQDFERALEIDPRSVDARIGIATVLIGRVGVGWSSSRTNKIRHGPSSCSSKLLETRYEPLDGA